MNIKKGDRVRVKLWKDMQESDQVHSIGNESINELLKPYSFTKVMREFCGRNAVVVALSEERKEYLLKFDGEEEPTGFIFREWMLETAQEDKPDSVTVYIVEKD